MFTDGWLWNMDVFNNRDQQTRIATNIPWYQEELYDRAGWTLQPKMLEVIGLRRLWYCVSSHRLKLLYYFDGPELHSGTWFKSGVYHRDNPYQFTFLTLTIRTLAHTNCYHFHGRGSSSRTLMGSFTLIHTAYRRYLSVLSHTQHKSNNRLSFP
jgi:hypothetical protein